MKITSILNTQIECDDCHQQFLPKDIELKKMKLTGVSVLYFECPFCKYIYPIRYIDKKQMTLDAQIAGYSEMLKHRIKRKKSVGASKIEKLETLKKFSEGYQRVLKERFDEYVTAELNELNKSRSGEETNSTNGKE